jgi:hypothetical protein
VGGVDLGDDPRGGVAGDLTLLEEQAVGFVIDLEALGPHLELDLLDMVWGFAKA